MSKSRAKKKQRQRARVASGAPAHTAGVQAPAERSAQRAAARHAQGDAPRPTGRQERGAAAGSSARQAPAAPAERHPSRLEERDGVRRPDPPWAPFPLSEIGMAVGIVLFGVGFFTGGSQGPRLLTIGAVLLSVVVAELCLREHFAGFRSHSILLGLLPVTAAHMLVFYAITPEWTGPVALAGDLAVAGALAYWLQRRFRVVRARARAL